MRSVFQTSLLGSSFEAKMSLSRRRVSTANGTSPVHHGSDIEDSESFKRFVLHGLKMFLKLIKLVDVFETKDQLLDHIDRMKLSVK